MKIADMLRVLRAIDDDDPQYDPAEGEEEPDPDVADPDDDDVEDERGGCPDCEPGTCPYETGEAY